MKSDSQSMQTSPLIKQIVKTDKKLQDGNETSKQSKQQEVNEFPATKNLGHIKQLECHPAKGNWHCFDLMDIGATEIIQTCKQVSTGKHIRHFCPWAMKKDNEKETYC